MTDVRITIRDNGNIKVEGPVTVLDGAGNPFPSDGGPVFLCRCGHSQDKPFCDGSHRAAGFASAPRATAEETAGA